MKKTFLSLLLLFVSILFFSCDDSLPEVSVEEAKIALFAVAEVEDLYDADGVSLTATNESMVLTLTGVEFSEEYKEYIEAELGLSFPYTSISGTMTVTETADSAKMVYDFSLVGGPVVTVYISATMTGLSEDITIYINEHNMTSDLKSFIE